MFVRRRKIKNGHYYYLQHSVRVGKKIKTLSWYLGLGIDWKATLASPPDAVDHEKLNEKAKKSASRAPGKTNNIVGKEGLGNLQVGAIPADKADNNASRASDGKADTPSHGSGTAKAD
jgi:hypothetical protein